MQHPGQCDADNQTKSNAKEDEVSFVSLSYISEKQNIDKQEVKPQVRRHIDQILAQVISIVRLIFSSLKKLHEHGQKLLLGT